MARIQGGSYWITVGMAVSVLTWGGWFLTAETACASSFEEGVISVGRDHSLCIRSDGSLWAWGYNGTGQLGTGDTVNRSTPVRVGGDNDWKMVSAGLHHSLGIRTDGTLWAWGYNGAGRLGTGDIVNKSTPVQVGYYDDWMMVSAGKSHSLGIRSYHTHGTLWAWGDNSSGQLGTGDTVNKSTPVRVGGDNNWKVVSAGYGHSLGIRSDGTLWAWGDNSSGQLGTGDTVSKSTPVQVGYYNYYHDWKMVSAGGKHSLGIRSDGSLWAWGDNSLGQLGLGDTVQQRGYPSRVGTDRDWRLVFAGSDYSLGIKSDGSLWAWGYNFDGQLGTGDTVNRSTPVRVGSSWGWQMVSVKSSHSLGVKSDGSLWAWGDNSSSQLGCNGVADKSLTPCRVMDQIKRHTSWSVLLLPALMQGRN